MPYKSQNYDKATAYGYHLRRKLCKASKKAASLMTMAQIRQFYNYYEL